MARYVVRRLAHTVLVLLGASAVLFTCLHVVPGDPLATQQGEGRRLDEATRAALEERYGLDRSLPGQYAHYLGRLVRGDMGESYTYRRPVSSVLAEKLGNTARLALAALAVQVVVGGVAGVVAALSRRRFVDVLVTVSTTLAIGLPTFVVGLALQQVFAVELGWLPLQGSRHGLRSLVLPAVTLASVGSALVARLTRGTMLDVMGSDYVRAASAKGLARRAVVLRHALPNAVIPVVTMVGITVGAMLGGALVTETVFNWDGVGLALVSAIQSQDNPVVLAVATYGVAVFAVVNLAVDLTYAALDPRVRLG